MMTMKWKNRLTMIVVKMMHKKKRKLKEKERNRGLNKTKGFKHAIWRQPISK